MSRKPSKIHDPRGYERANDSEDFWAIVQIGAIVIVGIVLLLSWLGA